MIYSLFHRIKLSHYLGRYFLTEEFFPFRLLYGIFRKISWTKKVRRNGAEFKILLKDGMGLMNFIPDYETWLDLLIPKLLDKQNGIFIDVGSNTGQTLLKVVPRFPDIGYYAIEPNVNCVRHLNSLCELNSFTSVRILNYALTDSAGETDLLMRYRDDILATTSPSFRKFTRYSSTMKVPTTTGDSIVEEENIKKISVIKIDVEGGEAKVISGFVESIRLFQPYIICEILPLISKDADVSKFRVLSAQQILTTLSDLNYIIYNIGEKKKIYTIEEISSSLESSNYLFIPGGHPFNF
jgi:FkbM family methyltransferase